MGFIIHDRDALVSMGSDANDMLAIQNAINNMERNGWPLHSVVDQHRVWPEGNELGHLEGPYFIFQSQDVPGQVRRSGSLG